MENLKDIVIIYHSDCPDGFGAAWAAWKALGDTASYLPVLNRAEVPEGLEGKEVYTLDYSFREEQVRTHAPLAKRWVIIDHHVTNEPAVAHATDSLFDLGHSGAALSWSYFHKEAPTPTLIKYVENADLWKFELPNAREITQAIASAPRTFESWNKLELLLETKEGTEKLRAEGELMRTMNERDIAKLAENAEEVMFEGHRVYAVNSALSRHTSELGHVLYTKLPPMALIWSRRGKRVVVSLRSDGSVDVAKIAQKYGGGGHPQAAAFSWDADTFVDFEKAHKS
ncbi:MAG: DHHA1 domain-containing protein [Patescibacteria group bacterium]